ncbi:MAG: hypothetical protein J1F67_11435 [Muribaculaceae bacterium]|nr:hypothetical protein [Muribaculaceae bacterium]
MKKFLTIAYFLLFIILSTTKTLAQNENEVYWMKLFDFVRSGDFEFKENGIFLKKFLFDSPRTFISKIAFEEEQINSNIKIKIFEIDSINIENITIYKNNPIIIDNNYTISTQDLHININELFQNTDNKFIYEFKNPVVLVAIEGNLKEIISSNILENIYICEDTDIINYFLSIKENNNIIKANKLNEEKSNFVHNYIEKYYPDQTLINFNTLPDGTKIGNCKSGKTIIVRPNGDYKSFNHEVIILSDGTIVEDRSDEDGWMKISDKPVTIWFSNGDSYEGRVSGNVSNFINSYEKRGRKFIEDTLNRSSWEGTEKVAPGHLELGNYEYANGKVVEIKDGLNEDLHQKKIANEKAAKEKETQDKWNKLYAKYGKSMVEKLRNRNITVGMPYSLIDEFCYLSTYHQTSSNTWYKAEFVSGGIQFIKINNSTNKVVEVSKRAPTVVR